MSVEFDKRRAEERRQRRFEEELFTKQFPVAVSTEASEGVQGGKKPVDKSTFAVKTANKYAPPQQHQAVETPASYGVFAEGASEADVPMPTPTELADADKKIHSNPKFAAKYNQYVEMGREALRNPGPNGINLKKATDEIIEGTAASFPFGTNWMAIVMLVFMRCMDELGKDMEVVQGNIDRLNDVNAELSKWIKQYTGYADQIHNKGKGKKEEEKEKITIPGETMDFNAEWSIYGSPDEKGRGQLRGKKSTYDKDGKLVNGPDEEKADKEIKDLEKSINDREAKTYNPFPVSVGYTGSYTPLNNAPKPKNEQLDADKERLKTLKNESEGKGVLNMKKIEGELKNAEEFKVQISHAREKQVNRLTHLSQQKDECVSSITMLMRFMHESLMTISKNIL